MRRQAGLLVIAGCMFSGKTDELIRNVNNYTRGNRKVSVFKANIDVRYSVSNVKSHNGGSLDAIPVDINKPELLLEMIPDDTFAVAIDEAQFFNARLIQVCRTLVDRGLVVICAGLKQDFRGEPFGIMPQLLAEADEIRLLTAICTVCGEDADKTQRLNHGIPVPYSAEQVQVGGAESYEARCRLHHVVPGRP